MLLDTICLGVGAWLLFLSIHACLAVEKSRSWCASQADASQEPQSQNIAIFVLIPVLREQHQLEDAVDHFIRVADGSSANICIVFITTEREDADRDDAFAQCQDIFEKLSSDTNTVEEIVRRYPGLGPRSLVIPILEKRYHSVDELRAALQQIPTSRQVIEREIRRVEAVGKKGLVRVIHYPYANQDSVMAHQVNYGVRYLFEVSDGAIIPDQTYVALYNADSRPDLRTLNIVCELANQEPSLVIAQQYSLYTARNHHPLLTAAAIWQTRWSLAVELRRALKQTVQTEQEAAGWMGALKWPFAYPVGHGLFVRLDFLVRSNYLPQTVSNEDQCLGYLLAIQKIRLIPVPVFDHSLVPPDIYQLSRQQSSWFLGPASAFEYVGLARQRKIKQALEFQGQVFALKVLFDAFAWVAGPLAFAAILAWAALSLDWRASSLCALYVIYLVVPSIAPAAMIKDKQLLSFRKVVLAIAMMPTFYLIHGLSPLRSISLLFMPREQRLFRKPKTDS